MRLRLFLLLSIVTVLLASAGSISARRAGTKLVVEIEGKGKIGIELYTQDAPKTCARIIELANAKFYDGQRFFRVIRQPRPFLAQIGDPNSRTRDMSDSSLGTAGTGHKLAFEDSGHKHQIGSVGLSRLPNDRNSGDCQFYIVIGRASFLDGQYTVFGQVVDGTDLLDKLDLGDRVTTARIVKE